MDINPTHFYAHADIIMVKIVTEGNISSLIRPSTCGRLKMRRSCVSICQSYVWDGNLSVTETLEPRRNKSFRMCTNLCSIENGNYGIAMNEYDLDPEKTLKKLELAIEKAHRQYMTLPKDM